MTMKQAFASSSLIYLSNSFETRTPSSTYRPHLTSQVGIDLFAFHEGSMKKIHPSNCLN